MKAYFLDNVNLYFVHSLIISNNAKYNKKATFLFDTGAADTIISPSMIYSLLMIEQIKDLDWDSSGAHKILASSAFGDKKNAYKACLYNIRLSGVLLDKFYCYIVPDVNEPFALLGNDFIKYCSFSSNIDGGIDFFLKNKDDYYNSVSESYLSKKLNSILNLVYTNDSSKDCPQIEEILGK